MSRSPCPALACEAEDSLRDTIARGVYDVRPFTIAQTGGVMDVMRIDRVLGWDEAPSFYRSECYEIADGVMARMLLAQAAALAASVRQAA